MDYAAAASVGQVLNPRVHRLVDGGSWLQTLKDRTGNDRLFLYHHQLEDSFVLCAWVYTPEETTPRPAIAMELEVFPDHPLQVPPEMAFNVLVARCRPDPAATHKVLDRVKAGRKERQAAREIRHDARMDMAKFYDKKGLTQLAQLVRDNVVPFQPVDHNDEAGKELEQRSRERVTLDLGGDS